MYELVEGFICKSTIIKGVINAATGVSTLLGCISTRCWSIALGIRYYSYSDTRAMPGNDVGWHSNLF